MTTTPITPIRDVPLPPNVRMMWDWRPDAADPPYRMIFGTEWEVTDHDAWIETRALQLIDGSLHDVGVVVHAAEEHLNSDQARELAAALLKAAAEIDGWLGR